jgi:hypothetical protein
MDTYPNDGKFSNDWLWYGMAEFYLLNGTFKNLEKDGFVIEITVLIID